MTEWVRNGYQTESQVGHPLGICAVAPSTAELSMAWHGMQQYSLLESGVRAVRSAMCGHPWSLVLY
jgi:hypothetical protein